VRRFDGGAREVRVVARAPLPDLVIGSGAQFERVRVVVDGHERVGVLKVIAPDPICVTRERRFYEELREALPVRAPHALGSGEIAGRVDGWVLLDELPPSRRWRPERVGDVAREVAKLHRATLGRVPDWLPRPFSRDLAAALAHVPEGIERLEALQRREPGVRALATPRTLALGRELARDLSPLSAELARSPEAVVHRDLHPGNVWLPADGGAPILFDWEAVSAGPPIFDVTLLHQSAPIRQLRVPGRPLEIGFFRARGPAWAALERAYLDALGDAPREAIASAANGAFVWEALYRLGWCASVLEGRVPRASLALARVPGLRALGRVGDLPALCAAWQAMFADFERRAAALLG
jgi:aminoglycoside phosphotransferase (APT) family kinase protein